MHGRHPRQIIWLTIREIELDRGPMQFRQCRFGSKADISARAEHVHFTTKSEHWVARFECPLGAKPGMMIA